MPFEIRAVERDELSELVLVDQRAFGGVPAIADREHSWSEAELPRTRAVFDGGEAVGLSRNYTFGLTLPGGASLPAAAVSWVGVAPTHRRRGVLTQMMAALHADARDHDEPVAILTASESSIYGRFGYGIATWRLGQSAERAAVRFRSDASPGHVRMLTRPVAEPLLPPLYERLRATRPGAVTRPDYWWPSVFWDQLSGPEKAFFVAVHSSDDGTDDGFVAYDISGGWVNGIPDRRLTVWDMQAYDPDVRAALWRFVFGVDLVKTVTLYNGPIDDPLRHIVTDSRRIRVDFVNDGLWLAPLDPARLLAARRYAIDDQLVIEVHHPDGATTRVVLDGGPDDASCVPTTREPHIVCPADTLGACVLGGNRWSELAQARRLECTDARVLVRADAMFMSTPAPAMLTAF